MIKINPVENFDRFRPKTLKENSARELLAATQLGNAIAQTSELSYALEIDGKEVIIFGVMPKATLLGQPNLLWLLALKKLSMRHAREIKSLFTGLVAIYNVLWAKVEADHPVANRFAKFLGMTAVGMDGIYRIYEAKKCHF